MSDPEKRWDAIHAAYGESDLATRLMESLSMETDRGCVLVAAALLDLALKNLLTSFFTIRSGAKPEEISFFFEGQVPPLQSTSLKIRIAQLLGLVERNAARAMAELQSFRSTVAAHSYERVKITKERVMAMARHYCNYPLEIVEVTCNSAPKSGFSIVALGIIRYPDTIRKFLEFDGSIPHQTKADQSSGDAK